MKQKYSSIVYSILFALIAIGCTQQEIIEPSTNANSLLLSVENMLGNNPNTRAGDTGVNEHEIKNLWIIQFDENGNIPATPLYKPRYIADYSIYDNTDLTKESADGGANIKLSSGGTRTIWAIANTFDSKIFKDITNIDDLYKLHFSLESPKDIESDMWIEDGGKHLRLAGKWTGVVQDGKNNIHITLSPLAAKISFSYECENTATKWVKINEVTLQNVYKKEYYTLKPDNARNADFTSYNTQPTAASGSDLGFTSGTRTFYVPANFQGEKLGNTTESDKTKNAPENATFIKLEGILTERITDDTGVAELANPITIKIYPGGNKTTDYNIKNDHNYSLKCKIKAENNASWDTDHRVDLDISLPEGAVVHYEFDPNNKSLNSAYTADGTAIFDDKGIIYELTSSEAILNTNQNSEVWSRSTEGDGNSSRSVIYLRNLSTEANNNGDCKYIYDRLRYDISGTNPIANSYLKYQATDNFASSKNISLSTNWPIKDKFFFSPLQSDYNKTYKKYVGDDFGNMKNPPEVAGPAESYIGACPFSEGFTIVLITMADDTVEGYDNEGTRSLYGGGRRKYGMTNFEDPIAFDPGSSKLNAGRWSLMKNGNDNIAYAVGNERFVEIKAQDNKTPYQFDENKKLLFFDVYESNSPNTDLIKGKRTVYLNQLNATAKELEIYKKYDGKDNSADFGKYVDINNIPIVDENKNGSNIDEIEAKAMRNFPSNRELCVFGQKLQNKKAFQGNMYLFLVYNRPLTTDEMSQIKSYANTKLMLK